MSRRREKLTRADFTEYKGYFWRQVPQSTVRCRVYAPTGQLLYQTARSNIESSIDQDIAHQARRETSDGMAN